MNRTDSLFKRASVFALVLSIVLTTLLIVLVKPGICKNDEFRVINVKNVVRLDREREKDYMDYLIDFGTKKGAKIGNTLKAYRQVIKHSEVESVNDRMVTIPTGTLKVISVYEDSCIARLSALEKRDVNPLVDYDSVMIGDAIVLIKETEKMKAEVMVLPETVLFDFDKYALKKEAVTSLENVAEKIKKGDFKRIDIATHTDSIGSHEYNLELSRKRAQSIYDYFTKRAGLPEKMFTIKGYGETKPIASNKTKVDRQKNRRGEITFFKE